MWVISDVEVEPYLYSRNTIGHGNHNSNSQRPKRVKIVGVDGGQAMVMRAESGGGMRNGSAYAEVNLERWWWLN